MTKIKNTKKGMAKKTLSMSLVVAMLATSNVPVWAADVFSDGSDAAVTSETETADTETFSDDTTDAPAVEDNETATAASAESASDNLYTGSVTFTNVTDNAIEWGSTINANVTVTNNQTESGSRRVYYAWKIGGVASEYTYLSGLSLSSSVTSSTLNDTDAGKTISLLLAVKDDEDNIVWTYESSAITIKKKQISNYVKVSSKASIPAPKYDGTEKKEEVPFDLLVRSESNEGDGNLTDETKYKVTYTASDFINVTDEGIKVTLTPDESKLPGYTGEITYTYKIQPKNIVDGTAASKVMKATLKNTSCAYTGTMINKIKASDIELVDATTGDDLSNYLKVDEDGYVSFHDDSSFVTVGKSIQLWVDLIEGTPKTGNKNYNITGVNRSDRCVQTRNELSIVARDLSTVTAVIPQQKYNNGKKVVIDPENITFKDTATGETLTGLNKEVEVSVPDNATESGETYTATISAKESSTNVTGSTTADFSVYSSDIRTAVFYDGESPVSLPTKDYTGDQITFTSKELGALKIKNESGAWVAVDPKDYEIVYSDNVNAGTATLTIVGKNSYKGSSKTMNFTINPASLSSVKTNDYVEIIDTQNAKDYKDALNLVVKATSGTGNSAKEFTLTSDDYTVSYAFDTSNAINQKVKATVTITNANFKGTATVNNCAESVITAKALKDEYIKLKETKFTYTGQEIKPDFDVVIDGKVINPEYYTVSYTSNIYAGTGTLTVTGTGTKYSDKISAKVTFTIDPAKTEDLVGVLPSKQYKGYSLEVPADEIYATLNGDQIDIDKNFTLSYGENLNIGEGTVTLTPKNGNFTGTKTFTFNIVGELISGGDLKFYDKNGVEVNQYDVFTYDGTEHTFAKTVFDTSATEYADGTSVTKKLVEGTDYEIKYVDNVYGKDYYGAVLVIAKGQYGGAYDKDDDIVNGVYTDADGNKISNIIYAEEFYIEPQLISASCVTVTNGTYAGGLPVKPEVKIVVKGVTLVEGKDYDLEFSSRQDRTKATAGKTLNVYIVPKNGYASVVTQ